MAAEPLTEAQILEGCRSGDPQAAAALVQRYGQSLFRTVLRMVGRRAVAEEIVQEALLRTFEHIDRIDPSLGAGRWMFRVALNLTRNHLGKGAHGEVPTEVHEDAEPLFAGLSADPERTAVASEWRRRVEHALLQIPPAQREVVLLRHAEGLSFPEIARRTGTAVAVLQVRAFRARAALRALLKEPAE